MKSLMPFLIALMPAAAGANCACQCVEGVPRTLCTSLAEARDGPSLCAAVRSVCPLPEAGFEPRRYAPPEEGATGCRDARLYDVGEGRYAITVKLCDTNPPLPG